jgi:hypothetical protein
MAGAERDPAAVSRMGRGMSESETSKARIKALDRDLEKLARAKGGKKGWLWPFLFAVTLITVILPVGWVLVYRFVEAPGTILMVERAIGGEKIQRSTVQIERDFAASGARGDRSGGCAVLRP